MNTEIGPIVTAENPALAEQMRRHHFRRMFQYLRIEACARRNDAPDLADEAKTRAAYHGHLARSIKGSEGGSREKHKS